VSEEKRPFQQTTEQKRAAQAWRDVSSIAEKLGPRYGPQARRLPTLIQTNGLGQTVAFLKSKPDNRAMRLAIGDHPVVQRPIPPGDSRGFGLCPLAAPLCRG